MFYLNTFAIAILLGFFVGVIGAAIGLPPMAQMMLGLFVGMQAPKIAKALMQK